MQPPRISLVQSGRKEGCVMLTNPVSEMRKTFDPSGRGYHAVYHEHEVNHCPGCGRTHWIIGRISAECAFCATALPLAEASMRSHKAAAIIQHKNRDQAQAWAA
jgi:hypothetical protein